MSGICEQAPPPPLRDTCIQPPQSCRETGVGARSHTLPHVLPLVCRVMAVVLLEGANASPSRRVNTHSSPQ